MEVSALIAAEAWGQSLAQAIAAGRFALGATAGGMQLSVRLEAWIDLALIEGFSSSATLADILSDGRAMASDYLFRESDAAQWGTTATWGQKDGHYQRFDGTGAVKSIFLDLASGILSSNGRRAASSGFVFDSVEGGAGNDTLFGAGFGDRLVGGRAMTV